MICGSRCLPHVPRGCYRNSSTPVSLAVSGPWAPSFGGLQRIYCYLVQGHCNRHKGSQGRRVVDWPRLPRDPELEGLAIEATRL